MYGVTFENVSITKAALKVTRGWDKEGGVMSETWQERGGGAFDDDD